MADVLQRLDVNLEPDPRRTMLRPFGFEYPDGLADGRPDRAEVVADRVLAISAEDAEKVAVQVMDAMDTRLRNATAVLLRRYDELPEAIRSRPATEAQKLLIGATFSQEYAFESAALFNPSIIVDPDREVPEGCTAFLLSLRGIGEGHISSITFRRGIWHKDGTVQIDPPGERAIPPRVEKDIPGGGARIVCEDSTDVSESVIFPILPSQQRGVEDLRLVAFTDDDGTSEVIGTYTAFDGKDARCELLHGIDFRTVEMRPLQGRMASYKGMALFPRRIDGKYVMLGRMDSERIWLLRSDDLYTWEEGEPIMAPRHIWEWVQLGNCGSPIEVDEGWLVLTHGVGPMRSYSMGACLLDKDDPSKVLRRMPVPLLSASIDEIGGYVPNVVYGCGMLARGRDLLVPFGIGDRTTTFATGTVDAVLDAMEPA